MSSGCDTRVAKDSDGIQDVKWGEPVKLSQHMGKAFTVVGAGGPGQHGFFPLKVPRKDGSITYLMKVQFTAGHLRMTNYCIYQNDKGAITGTLTAEVDALGDQIEYGYVMRQSQEKRIEQDGKKCGVQMAPGTYSLFSDKKSLRMYVGPENYMELVEVH